jgi:hypothetical protein
MRIREGLMRATLPQLNRGDAISAMFDGVMSAKGPKHPALLAIANSKSRGNDVSFTANPC